MSWLNCQRLQAIKLGAWMLLECWMTPLGAAELEQKMKWHLKAAGFAPGEPVLRRLRLEFASWIARIATPALNAEAIRALQKGMPRDVADYFELEGDGSFTFDTLTIEAQ